VQVQRCAEACSVKEAAAAGQQACLSTLEGQRGMLLMFQGCSAYRRSSSAAEHGTGVEVGEM
jgi:hypothetical protein